MHWPGINVISFGCFSRVLAVVGMVERLVPDELWKLFQRVVPEAPSVLKVAGGVGTVIARCWPRSCSWDKEIHVVLDNLSTHTTPEVKAG